MADNYCQVTITPLIPPAAVTEEDRKLLEQFGFSMETDTDGNLYFYHENYAGSAYAEVEGEDGEIVEKDIGEDEVFEALQGIVQRTDELDCLFVEGAYTCDRMRPGEFGGFAVFISANEIDHISTIGWLGDKKDTLIKRLSSKSCEGGDSTCQGS